MASGNSTRHAHNFKDLTGQRLGHWTVIGESHRSGKVVYWTCVCDCGNTSVVAGAELRNGHSSQCRSCGSSSHGCHSLPEYKIWMGINCRCHCKNASGYERYGDRGIGICEEWKSFEIFFRDMGPRPSPAHSIERIDNDGDYCKANCRWATRTEQMRNMSRNHLITYQGQTLCLQEWSDRLGINKATLRKRLDRGWSVERALAESPRNQPREILLTFNGKTMNVAEWATVLGIPAPTLYTRLDAGWSLERALTAPST